MSNQKQGWEEPLHPEWSRLSDDDLKPIRAAWEGLIAKPKVHEETIHAFLAKHGQLAFGDHLGFATVISKLRLGADLVTDFVVVYDNWSVTSSSRSKNRGRLRSQRRGSLHPD